MVKDAWPQWLKDANTRNAQVEITASGRVVWWGGTWYGGEWFGGDWRGGIWYGGIWHTGTWSIGIWRGGIWYGGIWRGGIWYGGEWFGGDWYTGDWYDGIWRDGAWYGGIWHSGDWRSGDWRGGDWYGGTWFDGVWHGGIWHDGIWRGGDWYDPETVRLLYHAGVAGINPDAEGQFVGYRVVKHNYSGYWTRTFLQKINCNVMVDYAEPGKGTCKAGLHVTSAARAYTYFGVDPTARLIRVRFPRENILDADGKKVRIKGGYCEEIPWPWKVDKQP